MVDVRLLLDTGPTEAEVARVEARFAAHGLTVTTEGHSYGGPPPTSAFLIVVNTLLAPFLDRLTPGDLAALTADLLALRADPARWGRPHRLKFEDAQTGHAVLMDAGLPPAAYTALLDLDLARFDRGAPPVQVEWHPALALWQARLITVAGRATVPIPARGPAEPRLRPLTERETGELWRLIDPSGSEITRRRAAAVLSSSQGWNAGSVARRLLLSERRVRALVDEFNTAGLASLSPDYTGVHQVEPGPDRRAAARAAARRTPADFGRPDVCWSPAALAEFLVAEGLLEDVTPELLKEVLS
uniref:helix-turn-helix domain-containing protein n=1 Tax=Herbidospora sakaeratensis TaxID=564415 RepID=UPI000785FB94|nr:helix-turn-helix domain-containing protein [Herbidospora sakaeratensis]